ncbi:hypothetical protein PSH58_10705 [Pseudomonas hefeiensis]|uniref:Uncharacterized protein n=1 Tax=Pseudomonas hefeiensis TaxID=2738125 RepID=A0ABY9GGY9_9PSED|nr:MULTISPECIES: hypothetical protein [unclassified Pseudomonas]WLH14739.1 hypothetical protein PSH57_10685 [Pseudomonas sp. FP205]WLH97794.1 hypothetical protein PSH58_10705 [Pseudomonas sp. FP53]WLI42065.1 hypothetical protein PSH74_10670 [Pseudomonas sp. FP821]
MIAITQWFVVALRPPHLAAIAFGEGGADLDAIGARVFVASLINVIYICGTFLGWQGTWSRDRWLRVYDAHDWNEDFNPANTDDLLGCFDHVLKV